MQILIVDDEMVSRTKLETLMTSMGQCQTADCGTVAIDLYYEAHANDQGFDLVMLDIDMPDMQGEEVLRRIRQIENYGPYRAAVVMVTAQSGADQVFKCLKSGCDEYIAKPFNLQIIMEKLKKLGLLNTNTRPSPSEVEEADKPGDKIFLEISAAIRTGKLKLPVMPQIGIQFRDLVRIDADRDQLSKLLKQDTTLAANLIRVSNSALYRGFGKVKTVEQAISRLGLSETEKIVAALTNRQMFNTGNRKYTDALQRLWLHSLASAYAAELLADSLALEMAIDPFTAGLLHDIGALALLNIIAQMETRGRYEKDIDAAALSETIVDYHAMFGVKLLEMWGFETGYARTTLCHNRLYTAESLTNDLLVVHFANLVSKSLGYTFDGQPYKIELVDSQSAKELKLTIPQITSLKSKVADQMEQSAGLWN